MRLIEYSYDRLVKLETMLETIRMSRENFEEFNGVAASCLVKFCDRLLEDFKGENET